ncbi:hypothetical protein FA10DRAFT_73215 [Acaromyces ingoldii]|uniref:RRM domain-containing protein n=1 Tax=Acaromyces ingoldii TaxID=215250 RepID=A0A316YRG6_9BASI|nr:hypothetical protein FA10DRAFT_73215 [Acaromyces ingoldii]PWN91702.1 hypothetical protein FA10DRAFT_73215 [Acaromyces ingoldii]
MAKKDKRKSRAGEDEEGSSRKASKVASASAAPLSFDAELDALFSSAARQPEPAAPAASSSRNKSSVEEEAAEAAVTPMEDVDEEEESANVVVNEAGVGQEVVQDSEDDSDADGPPPVHETLLKKNAKSPAKEPKKKPAKPTLESRLEQDSHSLFVGNLPLSLATSKGDMKALKRHLVACSPYPFITIVKAVRLRSIPFSKPTDDYQADDPESAERGQKRRDRARAWKETEGGTVKDQEAGSKGKVFLNAKQKRKVAYIQGEVNEKADALNAYVTIDLAGQRRLDAYAQRYNADVSKLTDKTLAALLAFTSNNTLFRGRHIRCDLVRSLETSAILSAGLDQVRTPNGSLLGQSMGTNAAAMDINMRRRTIFVGNVDFEAKEEEVREFFEALVRRERGMPPEVKALDFSACRTLPKPESEQKPATASDAESQSASESEAESASGGEESAEEEDDDGKGDGDEDEEREAREEQAARPSSTKAEPYWVESVRLIRDSATQMGKGIAYVRFTDSTSVDELMAISEAETAFLEASKMGKTTSKLGTSKLEINNGNFKRRLKFKGKPLRLSRCKAATNSQASTPNKRHAAATGGSHSRQRSAGAPTPGGTSPSSMSRQNSNARAPNETPLRNKGSLSKGTPLSKPSPRSNSDSTEEKKIEVANPPPKRTDAAFMAKKAEKRADADRAAKRMEKKRKKVEERKLNKKIEEDVGTSGKVKLKMGGSKKKQGGVPSSKTKKVRSSSGARRP